MHAIISNCRSKNNANVIYGAKSYVELLSRFRNSKLENFELQRQIYISQNRKFESLPSSFEL